MKIISPEQTRQLDQYTIQHEPIASIDLMERASRAFCKWFAEVFTDKFRPVVIVCGPGNNGGDGLAIARLLQEQHYDTQVYLLHFTDQYSPDCQTNLERYHNMWPDQVVEITAKNPKLPPIPGNALLIDAIFGSGLNRPVEGPFAAILEQLNAVPATKVSVDIPSGLFADQSSNGVIFHADFTCTFQLPKLAFFFPENQDYVGEWTAVEIGLSKAFIAELETPFEVLQGRMLQGFLKKRSKFAHKGTFGHALLIGGCYGKVGAVLLASRAALRTGCGLVTMHVPQCAYEIAQISFPEAMVSIDPHKYCFTEVPDLTTYQAVGIGPGLGTQSLTADAFEQFLQQQHPLVIDADGLNLLSQHPDWQTLIPRNSILTPHPKEFERLFGKTENNFERNTLQRNQAQKLDVYLILKGAYTCIATPEGHCYFNLTGNPGMGTGGSGDVLTGILTSLIAQGYSPLEACLLGVYLHGLAGDLAAEDLEQEALLAGDLIQYLGKAFKYLRKDI